MAEKKAKNKLITQEQYHWIEIQKLLVKEAPDYTYMLKPEKGYRLFFYNLTRSEKFEIFILACIILNVVGMATLYEGCSIDYKAALNQINAAFTCIFIVEAGLKIMGMGVRCYFYSGWNKLDFFVVVMLDVA